MLKPLHFKPKNIKLATWDIETDYPDNPEEILLIGFYDGSDYYHYDNIDSFIKQVTKTKYYNYKMYAHNGGRFDDKFLLQGLENFDYLPYNILDVNGNILQIDIPFEYRKTKSGEQKPKYHISFIDSYMLLKDSLHKITHSFSDKVTHVKIENDLLNPDKEYFTCLKHKKVNCLQCYNEFDVKGLYQSIKYFEEILHKYNTNIKLTIASTSMNMFRNNYLKNWIPSINKDIKIGNILGKDVYINIEDEIRKHYIGGRTEIFKRYGEYLYYYDVNSLYPKVMRDNDFPVSSPIFILPENISRHDKGFFQCDIKINKNLDIPLLPKKIFGTTANKLLYPIGEWSGLYDIDMVKKAKSLGYQVDIKYGFIFDYDYIFKDFINDMYDLRMDKNFPSNKIIFKYLMNGLYGKFAQKRLNKQIVKITTKEQFDILENIKPYIDEFNLYEIEQTVNSQHIIPSLSNRVTQLSNLEIYKWYEKVNFDVYNTDTDSFVTQEKLKTSNELGDIKLEYEIDRAVFLLPKFYCFEGFDVGNDKNVAIKRMKGFSKGIDNITFDDFYNALFYNNFKPFDLNYIDMFGFKEALRRKKKFVSYDIKRKSLKSDYEKRGVYPDRINTYPLKVLNEIVIR